MSTIGGPGAGLSDAQMGFQGDHPDLGRDVGGRNLAGLRTGVSVADLAGAERIGQFEKSLRHAARVLSSDEGDDLSSEDNGNLALLASSQGYVSTGLPSPADAAPPPVAPRAEALVSTIQSRVDLALRSEARMDAARPMRLQVDFAGEVPGLKGLTVAMEGGRLDVVLVRSADAMPPELIAAAQALADRLRFRFSCQSVRVLDQRAGHSDTSGEDAG
jgi:hypothetical protein